MKVLKLPTHNAALRSALDLNLTAVDHKRKVAELSRMYCTTIEHDGFHNEESCVPFALSLTDDDTYEAIRRTWRRIYAGPLFVEWLLRERRLIETQEGSQGRLVFYFSDGDFKHVGILLNAQRAISKWGIMPRYRHDIADVPSQYGDCVRFFEPLPRSTSLQLFREFAKSEGLQDEEIERALKKWRDRSC